MQAGPGHQVKAGQGGWFNPSTPQGGHGGVQLRLEAQEGLSEKAGCVVRCSDGTTGWGLTWRADQWGENSFSWWQDGTQAQEPGTSLEATSQDDASKVPQGRGDAGRRGHPLL